MVVLDASVVIKWFCEEEGGGEALVYQQRHLSGELIHVPDLLLYEVANVLSCKPGILIAYVTEVLDILKKMNLIIHWPSFEGISRSAEIAGNLKIPVYDAAYLALAADLGAVFVTADQKLAAKCEKDYRTTFLSSS